MKRILLAVMMMFLVQSTAYAVEGKGKAGKFIKKKMTVLENIKKNADFWKILNVVSSPQIPQKT